MTGNGNYSVKAHFLSDHSFKLLDLGAVALEKLLEGSLCACGSLGTEKLQVLKSVFKLVKVHEQLIYPKSSSLAHSGELCGLEVGVCQSGHILVLICKCGKLGDNGNKLLEDDVHSVSHNDDIGVVTNIAGGSA